MKDITKFLKSVKGIPVCVSWYDPQGDDQWLRKDTWVPPPLYPVTSWGILYDYDDQRLVLCGHDSKEFFGNVTLIPIKAILSISTIKLSTLPESIYFSPSY